MSVIDKVVSPLANGEEIFLKSRIDSRSIIAGYKSKFGIDVSYIFKGTNSVFLYQGKTTGYSFYFPFHLSGDTNFYKHFGEYDWYYLPWKWEHNECAALIDEGDSILEVGSGTGAFLEGLSKIKNVSSLGLDLNKLAVQEGKLRGLNLIDESVEQHADNMPESYDLVCSFQVLEHIANVHDVIESMVKCLKPGGTLVISVPNNDSFIKDNPLPSKILNMPPHHMGLWNRQSLENLTALFSLELIDVKLEPLQPANRDTFIYVKVKYFLFGSNFLTRAFWKLRLHHILRPIVDFFSLRITGHTIMAVYRKSVLV